MRWVVVGAGAVGGYFGGRLAAAGEEVAFLARGATLAALREQGLRITSPLGDLHLQPVRATDRADELEVPDAILFSVKSWQLAEAAHALLPILGKDTVVLPLQNGVEAAQQLGRVLGAGCVLGGTCKIIAMQTEPGQIVHQGVEPTIALGELDRAPSSRAEAVAKSLRVAGVNAIIPPDIRVALWEKFLFMAPMSGLGALTRVPVGIVRSSPGTRELARRAMTEIFQIARARGVALGADAVERTLQFTDGLPPEGTGSMQRDIMAGRPSELDAHSGSVVRMAAESGVDAPVNRFLYHCLLPQERLARENAAAPSSQPAASS